MRGDLSRVADGFRCRQCDGTIQEVDLPEGLMVDGEFHSGVQFPIQPSIHTNLLFKSQNYKVSQIFSSSKGMYS